MDRIWITNGTPAMPGLLNPLAAACDNGYIPDEARIPSNPGVAESVVAASDMFETIINVHGGDAAVSEHRLETETDFQGIIEFYQSTIEAAHEGGDTIAVDVTPGRKFMSAIAFQACFRFGSDHVFYFYRKSGAYYGGLYAEIPRTATELIDFSEVM